MADTKISALPAASAAAGANELPINEAGASKKVTLTQVADLFAKNATGTSTAAGPHRTSLCLSSNSADNSSVTPAAVMTITGVGVGTWRIKGVLCYQTAATGTGIGILLNHTGTLTRFVSNWIQLTTGGTAATGVGDQATATVAGQMVEGKAERVKNTLSSASAGVDTANADQLAVLDAIIIVSASGDLELKIASEVAASAVRLMAGSVLELEQVA